MLVKIPLVVLAVSSLLFARSALAQMATTTIDRTLPDGGSVSIDRSIGNGTSSVTRTTSQPNGNTRNVTTQNSYGNGAYTGSRTINGIYDGRSYGGSSQIIHTPGNTQATSTFTKPNGAQVTDTYSHTPGQTQNTRSFTNSNGRTWTKTVSRNFQGNRVYGTRTFIGPNGNTRSFNFSHRRRW